MTSTFSDTEEPSSPDPPGWGVNYTPTKDDPEFVEFHGRRRARMLNGQDPQKNPEKFTPVVNPLDYKWPSNLEAKESVEKLFRPNKRVKKLQLQVETPAVSGASCSSSAPVTEETAAAAAKATILSPSQPFQL